MPDTQTASAPKSDVAQAFTRLAAVAGTSTCHLAMSDKPIFVNGVWGPYRDVLIEDYWLAEGGQSATGQLLKHVLETHPAYPATMQTVNSNDTNIYSFLNEHLSKMATEAKAPSISYLARHIFFYGDLFGNRSPIADSSMRGSMIGLSPDTSLSALALSYYSTLEFIALQTRHIITRMNDSGHSITSIFMSGSQCQNPLLMALIANACGIPVLIPEYVHAAVVHGAAMLGARAATGKGLWEIMNDMSKPGRTVLPAVIEDKGDQNARFEKKLLDAKYAVFEEMCEQQQRVRRDVDAAIQGWAAA